MPGNLNFGGAALRRRHSEHPDGRRCGRDQREVPTIAAASPVVNASGQLVFGNQNWFVRMQGHERTISGDPKLDRGAGRVLYRSRRPSCGPSDRVRQDGRGQAVSRDRSRSAQTIRVRNLPFRVVGVLAAKGRSMVGQDQDDTAVIPYTTAQRKLLGQQIPSINQAWCRPSARKPPASRSGRSRDLLRQRTRLRPASRTTFMVRNMTDAAQTFTQLTTIMTLLLGSIAAISLVVGGIGIMNIMLVSVTERTREIGIRMAVGARPNYVRLQFLTESLVLSLMGGLIGVLIGGGIAALVSKILGWPTLVSALVCFDFVCLCECHWYFLRLLPRS